MNGVSIPTDQIMPWRQRLSGCAQDIRASGRKPIHGFKLCRGEPYTFGNMGVPMPIITAACRGSIQQSAGNICWMKIPGVFVFKLMQAALAAAIAKRLPLGTIKRLKRHILPKSAVHLIQRDS